MEHPSQINVVFSLMIDYSLMILTLNLPFHCVQFVLSLQSVQMLSGDEGQISMFNACSTKHSCLKTPEMVLHSMLGPHQEVCCKYPGEF